MRLINIEKFYSKMESLKEIVTPCRNDPQITEVQEYFRQKPSILLHFTTITIGSKWLGMKSVKEQYEVFKRDIKKHIRYHGDQKYLYHFEIQRSGMLHAHGIELDTYQGRFIKSFEHYGKHNCSNKSF